MGGAAEVYAAVPDGSGGWYIGGDFQRVGNYGVHNLAHVRSAGTIDGNFGPVPDNSVTSLALDGSTLYVGGNFLSITGVTRHHIAALNTANGVPTNWDANADSSVGALVLSGSTLYTAGGSGTSAGRPVTTSRH